jgi:Fic family protein
MTKHLQNQIISYFLRQQTGKSSEVIDFLREQDTDVADITIKRALSALAKDGQLRIEGQGPATRYHLTARGRLTTDIDAAEYCAIEPDQRYGQNSFNFELFEQMPETIITEKELAELDEATNKYAERLRNQSDTAREKELERYVIELSWKSSQIEGNTYTILDTERLIRDGIEAAGHSKDEATMILNHKTAFREILEKRNDFKSLSRYNLEHVHTLLTADLGIATGFRSSLVGITGSRYLPLDNAYQIGEAVEALVEAVARLQTGYEKALLTLLGVSYIQPFEDGNKRTARLTANAILLAHGLAPLSYRSVDIEQYRNAVLAFYELNTLQPFKRIFIDQYKFAASNYAVR